MMASARVFLLPGARFAAARPSCNDASVILALEKQRGAWTRRRRKALATESKVLRGRRQTGVGPDLEVLQE